MAVDVLKQGAFLLACGAILLDIPQSMANEAVGCPAIKENTDAAQWWQIEPTDDGYVATLENPMGAGLMTMDLDMDGPSAPVLLGWEVLSKYNGGVGLLHYYSGSTGGHVSADVTRYVVINLDQSKPLANLEATVSIAGTRWIEHDDGTLEEEEILENGKNPF